MKYTVNDYNLTEFDRCSRENPHFQGASSILEMLSQILALFKEFKDMHEP